MERLREWSRQEWQDLRDQVSLLENLYAAALATAILAVGVEWLLQTLELEIPPVLSPGLGFAIAAVVAGTGYVRGRDRRRECRSRVATEIATVLDRPFIFGSPDWMTRATLRSGEPITIRALSEASRAGHLHREVWGNEYGDLAERLRMFANDFERATSHCMSDLGPPRARSLTDEVIRELGSAAAGADTTCSRMKELVGSISEATLAEEPSFDGLRSGLEGALAAGVALQQLIDRKRTREAAIERKRVLRERRNLQAAFNVQVVAASKRFLSQGFAVAELEHSTLHKGNATLEEVAADARFSFEPQVAHAGWTACWRQLVREMGQFREPLGGAPPEAVHQDALEYINTVTRMADELMRKCQYLIECLDDAPHLEERLSEVRVSIRELVAALKQGPSFVRSSRAASRRQ